MHALHQENERRHRGLPIALAAGLAWTLTGCTTSIEPLRPPAPRPLGQEIAAFVAPELTDSLDDARSLAEPTGRLRLRDSLVAALLRHPNLAASSWAMRAAEARVLQAGLPSNPELELEVEEFAGDDERAGFDVAEYTLGLSQEILLAGKSEKRKAVALLEGELAGWQYEATRLDVMTETAKAFMDVVAAQERLALLDESVQIGEVVLVAVGEQVRAGKVPPLDATRAKVELALHRLERDRVARELAATRRALAASWGSTSPLFETAEGRLYDVRPVPTLEQVANLLSQNPDVARWAVEMELHRANIELQRAERSPDITVAAGISHYKEDGGEAFSAGISIPLPIFDQNKGGVLEALADRRRAHAEMQAAAVRVRAALFEAHQALAVSSEEAGILRETILPAAEEAFTVANEGFRQGKFGFLDVLDAQRTQFEVKQQLVDALAAYHAAVADLERLIGQSLNGIETTDGDADESGPSDPQGDNQ